MNSGIRRSILLVIIISSLLAVIPVASERTEESSYEVLSESNAVFLEHNMIANGSVIKGTSNFRSINFPDYWFNENTRQINGKIDFPINDSLVMVFGDSLTLKGNFGAGTGNKLFGIYSLPVYADKAYIFAIDPYGIIGMYVNNETIYLKPGQQYSYQEKETLKDGNATIDVSYNQSYINRGLIRKTAIYPRFVS